MHADGVCVGGLGCYVSSCVSWMVLLICMAFVPVMICVRVGCACAPSVRTGWFL